MLSARQNATITRQRSLDRDEAADARRLDCKRPAALRRVLQPVTPRPATKSAEVPEGGNRTHTGGDPTGF